MKARIVLGTLRIVFGVSFLALVIVCVILFYAYHGAGSTTPNIRIGQVYSLNLHGSYRYVTETKRNNLLYVGAGAAFCFVLGAIADRLYKKSSK